MRITKLNRILFYFKQTFLLLILLFLLVETIPVFSSISHEGGSAALLVARDLGSLLERPIAKGHFWQHWLEWSADH